MITRDQNEAEAIAKGLKKLQQSGDLKKRVERVEQAVRKLQQERRLTPAQLNRQITI